MFTLFDSYIRVSRKGKRAGDSYITVDEQRRAIADAAKRAGVKLSGVEVVEEDVSGARKATSPAGSMNSFNEPSRASSAGIVVAFQDG